MRRSALLGFVIALLTVTGSAHASTNACVAAKEGCVVKRTDGTLKCHVLAEKHGADPVTDAAIQACLHKADDRFDGGADPSAGCFARVETQTPGGCFTSGDTPALASMVDAYVGDVVAALDPSYPAAVENACSAAKKKCVSALAAGLLKCHAKSSKPPGQDPEKSLRCLTKAQRRFDPQEAPHPGCFAKLETKYAGTCLTVGDSASLRARTVKFVDDARCALDPATCPAPTATPIPSFACCQIQAPLYCANLPEAPAAECIMFGGVILPGQVCGPGGVCIVPPTPTPSPTPP